MSIEPKKPEPNDDPDVDNEELLDAADETGASGELPAPEVPAGAEELVAWDELPDDAGHKTPTVPLEDEININQTLVNEGIDEADREQRIAAADPDLD